MEMMIALAALLVAIMALYFGLSAYGMVSRHYSELREIMWHYRMQQAREKYERERTHQDE